MIQMDTLANTQAKGSPDLRRFRLNTMQEVRDFKRDGGQDFRKYYTAMKKFLDNFPYDQRFDIVRNIPEKNWERFVKTACVYMVEQAVDEVMFSDDYLFIIRKRF